MPISIPVKGYNEPFVFPDGTSEAEIEAALRTIPPAEAQTPGKIATEAVKETGRIVDTGLRGAITALPGLIGDVVTGQYEWARKAPAALVEGAVPAVGLMSRLSPAFASALRDTVNPDAPLTPMAPSAALTYGMQKPKTTAGKLTSDVVAGVTGAMLPGGQLSRGMRLTTGVGSGLGTFAGEEVGGPVGGMIGGFAGGMAPMAFAPLMAFPNRLAKEVLHGVKPEQLDQTVATMRQMEARGIPVNASQAAEFASPLDAAVEHLTKTKAGQSLQDQLNAQPQQLRSQAQLALMKLPGQPQGHYSLNTAAQEAATDALKRLRGAAAEAFRKQLPADMADARFSQSGMAELAARFKAFAELPENRGTPWQELADDARKALLDPVQPSPQAASKLLNQFGQPIRGAQQAETRYLDNPLAVRDALESAIGSYAERTLKTSSSDSKLLAKQAQLRSMFKDMLQRERPEFARANEAYSTVMRESYNPAREGILGDLAGVRGYQEGVRSPSKILEILRAGTPLGAQKSDILTLERQLRKENPVVFQNAVRTLIGERFGKLLESGTNRVPEDLGLVLTKTFGNPGAKTQQWQTTQDMIVGSARAAGLDERSVLKGFQDLMSSAATTARRPSYMTMMDRQAVEQATGAEKLRTVGRINPFTMFRSPAFWAAERVNAKVLKTIADNLTSADGLLKLQALAREAPDSPMREVLMRSFVGTTAANADEKQQSK